MRRDEDCLALVSGIDGYRGIIRRIQGFDGKRDNPSRGRVGCFDGNYDTSSRRRD